MVAPRIMLLQILAACPAPGAAAMDDALAHGLEDRLRRGEGLVGAAAHEGEGACGRAADPARDRRVERQHARRAASLMGRLGALDVDGRAVDDERALGRGGQKVRVSREHVPAGRQHGDDHVGAGDGLARARGDADA